MLPFVLILVAGFFCGLISLRRFLARYPTDSQRSWWVRVSLFSVLAVLLMVTLILPLPNKQRLVAIVPAFFMIAVAIRVFRAARARMQAEQRQKPPDLERMKRLN